jgi:hypothetical protein
MSTNSVIDTGLIKAYEATNFHVSVNPEFILNINKPSAELQKLYKMRHVNCAAFITAWNPFSKSLSETENIKRNAQLQRELSTQGHVILNGYGQDPLKEWPAEDSYLVLGLGLEQAKALGIQYEQNAVVWCDIDAIPKLILLR